MSTSSQVYPALQAITPESMADVAPAAVGTDWYPPSSYPYSDPYSSTYSSSGVETTSWPPFSSTTVPSSALTSYPIQHSQSNQQSSTSTQQQSQQQQSKDSTRPRSSPSSLGPNQDAMSWPTSNPLGIYSSSGQTTPPTTSSYHPAVFQTYSTTPTETLYGSASPEIRQPQPRRPYTNIAPNPAGMAAPKRRHSDDSDTPENGSTPSAAGSNGTSKRRKRPSSVISSDLSEDDRFLVQLKEEENLPWKDIATRFQTDKGKNFQVAALQMRYKRLREKYRIWEEPDLNSLKLAHEYWEKYKWEIISAKMLDFGISERWPARHCARKWQELETTAATMAQAASMTPALSQFSSPVEQPQAFAFMPIQ